ncbi:MAG: hypothetical protein PHE70_07845 [Tepidanaerobacteraceae bacterium]|nr:hypothetical protein [Tepidanaerobacteraceae bacterium]
MLPGLKGTGGTLVLALGEAGAVQTWRGICPLSLPRTVNTVT